MFYEPNSAERAYFQYKTLTMFPMVSIIVDILDSPYFAAVISSVKRAASKYLLDEPTERVSLFNGFL